MDLASPAVSGTSVYANGLKGCQLNDLIGYISGNKYSVTFGGYVASWLYRKQNRSRTGDETLSADKICIVKHVLHVSAYISINRRPFYTSNAKTRCTF